MHRLDDIARDYDCAEVTALWLHERSTQRHILLYAVAELCPAEQLRSEPIEARGTEGTIPMMRKEFVPNVSTLYASRVFLANPGEAIAFYRGTAGQRELTPQSDIIVLEALSALREEPPNEQPVLIAEDGSRNYSAVLPIRPVGVRVCSRFSRGSRYVESLSERQRATLGEFSMRSLGIDLLAFREHVGSVHLMLPDPVLRGFDTRLGHDGTFLLVEFYEREGCEVRGCTLQLTDHRAAGVGFDIIEPVTGCRQIVSLPAEPQSLEMRLRDPHGSVIEHLQASFLKTFSLQMGLISHKRQIHTTTAAGEPQVLTVDTCSWDTSGAREDATSFDPSVELMQARADRELVHLEKTESFFFFPGGDESRDRARGVIRNLIGSARDRCMLCDPYLGAIDVHEYATFAKTSRLKVRLLGSASFLKDIPKEAPSAEPEGIRLGQVIRHLQATDKSLVLECRVLRGRDVSPVHDRFLMVDDAVYVLGSSLNELGRRATTLYRAPDAPRLIAAMESWWSNTSESLDDWINHRASSSGELS